MFAHTIIGVAVVMILSVVPPVLAQDSTGSARLDELKVRLATKVAELRTVVKRAMYGSVKSVSLTSLTIETKTKDIKIELTDDVSVTQLLNGKRTVLTTENIDANDVLTVFGTYDETLDLLKAQYIFIENSVQLEHLAGTIANVDSEDFVLTLNTPEGRSVEIDIEKTTKTTLWAQNTGIVKGGFSKITVGDTVHVVGTLVPKTENRIRAARILDLGNITGTASESATPKSTP